MRESEYESSPAAIAPAVPAVAAAVAALLVLVAVASPCAAQTPGGSWSAARYELTVLDDDSDAWHHAAVEVGARRTRLTPIARVSFASRFGAESLQLEGDLYPTWPGVGYAYLSAGWSAAAPFPDLRLAAEIFASLPRAFEVSAGVTYLEFDDDGIPILVGSASKYFGRYWLSVRPSWLPQDDAFALAGIGRRYMGHPDEHVTLRLVRGTTPETLETVADLDRLESLTVRLDAQLRVAERWLLLPLAGLTSEELPNGRGRMRTSFGVGVMYVF